MVVFSCFSRRLLLLLSEKKTLALPFCRSREEFHAFISYLLVALVTGQWAHLSATLDVVSTGSSVGKAASVYLVNTGTSVRNAFG